MKQRKHAYLGLRTTKLINDSGVAPKLVKLLMAHVFRVWDGSWTPDTVIRDMSTDHTYNMETNPRLMDYNYCVHAPHRTRHNFRSALINVAFECTFFSQSH